MEDYMNLCKAYKDNTQSDQVREKLKFSLAIIIPIVSIILTLALVHSDAPVHMVRSAAILGMIVAILVLYLTSLELMKERCKSEEFVMSRLTTSFIVSVFTVISQAIFLIYI